MYPFRPKSTTKMKAGQFWGVPLHDGTFACGVVLSVRKTPEGKRDSRLFLAGLLDWTGGMPPTAEQIHNRTIISYAFAHIKTITENGSDLLGELCPWWDWPEEIDYRDDIGTWGFKVISIRAEKLKKETANQAAQGTARKLAAPGR